MGYYILKRLGLSLLIVLIVSFVMFFSFSLWGPDPVDRILGMNARPEQIESLTKELGLDEPVLIRYFKYMGNAIRGDFGTSYETRASVGATVVRSIPNTLKLGLTGMILCFFISVPIGIIMALKQHSLFDNGVLLFTMILAAIPNFVLGLFFLKWFAVDLGWVPVLSTGDWKSFILPVGVVTVAGFGSFARYVKSVTLDALGADYIRTARSKGLSHRKVISRHLLKNIMIPIVTMFGISLAGVFGGSVILEAMFGIQGLGALSVAAVNTGDVPVIMCTTMLMAASFCIINTLVDITYGFIDPRIKAEYRKIKIKKGVM